MTTARELRASFPLPRLRDIAERVARDLRDGGSSWAEIAGAAAILQGLAAVDSPAPVRDSWMAELAALADDEERAARERIETMQAERMRQRTETVIARIAREVRLG